MKSIDKIEIVTGCMIYLVTPSGIVSKKITNKRDPEIKGGYYFYSNAKYDLNSKKL